jgi:hypothetical protein
MAFENLSFKRMIAIASSAIRGVQVTIPNRKQARAHIITLFQKQMKAMRTRFNVCSIPFFSFGYLSYKNMRRVLMYRATSLLLTMHGKHQTQMLTLLLPVTG